MTRAAEKRFLRPVLTGQLRVKYALLVLLWAAATLYFWQWWLRPEHVIGGARYGLVTVIVGWVFFLQLYFVFFLLRAVRSAAPDPRPGDSRVAMIVTKTPAEPAALLCRTLEAMLAQDHPHDTWLADEDPTAEMRAWCAERGVRISCRRDDPRYHRPDWPRRARCKEGNLAYFYDHWGYDGYDIVAQLDSDHVPQPGYLREMLRPFADPGVGYVSAPSICSSNARTNWSARTRLYAEAAFHGVLQAGYSNGFAPMCIGSHYAVRTAALRAVGGLGPELAEDHATTMMLNAGGWRGVHALDAIAIGDGPASVADMITQEFQWSRSLMTLLLRYSPRFLPAMPWRLKAQFLFCQSLYPVFAITMTVMYLLPIVAILCDTTYAAVTYGDYLGHVIPALAALVVIARRVRSDGLFRPRDAKIISWEKVLFVLLQWPWVLWGCIVAVHDRATGRFVEFRITPKGETGQTRLPVRMLMVYCVLALGCILPVMLIDDVQRAQGFYLLTLFNAILYSAAVIVTVLRHLTENRGRIRIRGFDIAFQGGILMVLISLTGYSMVLRSAESAHALAIGLKALRITEEQYVVAGASGGQAGKIHYSFAFPWQQPGQAAQ